MYLKPRAFLVTNAAAATRLTTLNIKVASVIIQAERSNTGYVYIGDNQVSATNYGVDLASGDSITLSAKELGWADAKISLKDIWHFSSVSGDGVSCMFLDETD